MAYRVEVQGLGFIPLPVPQIPSTLQATLQPYEPHYSPASHATALQATPQRLQPSDPY